MASSPSWSSRPVPTGGRAAPGTSALAGQPRGLTALAAGITLCMALGLALGGCAPSSSRQLDPALIWVSGDARLRTDTVGEGTFASQATFVLVDAENRGTEPAMVTLGGSFKDERGTTLGVLNPESLWIPPGGRRLFALVDKQRVPRPSASGAQLLVSGAKVVGPPIMHVESEHSFEDFGKVVVQARLVNDADRAGRAVVFGAFYDPQHRPMARPFTIVPIEARSSLPLQLVGPPGSREGTIFLGDLVY